MGNAIPEGKTLWITHCTMSIPLEFGSRASVMYGDPPAELEPEPTDKPHVYYVNTEKYTAWSQGLINKIRDEYNDKLDNDLKKASDTLKDFAKTAQPNLLTPAMFAVIPYSTVMKLTTIEWAYPPEETFKNEDMLLTVWSVIDTKEEEETKSEEPQTSSSNPEPKSKLVYSLHPLDLSTIPQSYIDNTMNDFEKKWKQFVKTHYEQLKSILSHERNNAVFSFVVRYLMPEEDAEKFEGDFD